MNTSDKCYSGLIQNLNYIDRFMYLKLDGTPCEKTFGASRNINQNFYHSREWRAFRDKIIIRDNGCDLGIDGYEIRGPILIHHINPINLDDLINRRFCVFDPENVICTKLSTHNAIHYGDESLLLLPPIERSKNDTCLWRQR